MMTTYLVFSRHQYHIMFYLILILIIVYRWESKIVCLAALCVDSNSSRSLVLGTSPNCNIFFSALDFFLAFSSVRYMCVQLSVYNTTTSKL